MADKADLLRITEYLDLDLGPGCDQAIAEPVLGEPEQRIREAGIVKLAHRGGKADQVNLGQTVFPRLVLVHGAPIRFIGRGCDPMNRAAAGQG